MLTSSRIAFSCLSIAVKRVVVPMRFRKKGVVGGGGEGEGVRAVKRHRLIKRAQNGDVCRRRVLYCNAALLKRLSYVNYDARHFVVLKPILPGDSGTGNPTDWVVIARQQHA